MKVSKHFLTESVIYLLFLMNTCMRGLYSTQLLRSVCYSMWLPLHVVHRTPIVSIHCTSLHSIVFLIISLQMLRQILRMESQSTEIYIRCASTIGSQKWHGVIPLIMQLSGLYIHTCMKSKLNQYSTIIMDNHK